MKKQLLSKAQVFKKVNMNGSEVNIPASWEVGSLCDHMCMLSKSKGFTIPSSKVQKAGAYPVISQAQQFIDGYVDGVQYLSQTTGPWIVFGDHSCTLKYVDFDFVLGGDGTQVFKTNAITKWLYYAILHRMPEVRTNKYQRHFKELKRQDIAFPDTVEQSAIAAVLTKQETVIQKLEQLIEKLGVRNDYIAKQLLAGELRIVDNNGADMMAPCTDLVKAKVNGKERNIPAGWTVATLGQKAKVNMGQSPSSTSYNNNKEGMVFYQGVAEFGDTSPTPRIYTTQPSKIAQKSDILFSVRAPVGRVNIADTQCCIGRGLAAISANEDTSYLFYCLKYSTSLLQEFSTGSIFAGINGKTLTALEFTFPPIAEQKKIGQVLDKLARERELYKQLLEKEKLRFDYLLDELMSGRLRVVEETEMPEAA